MFFPVRPKDPGLINQAVNLSRPGKAERDELRREQIVSAARLCVVRNGFHAASMAQIARQSGMSVGQIYRYFPSKEAIIHAIVQRIVNRRLEWLAAGGTEQDLPGILASRSFDDGLLDADDRVLLLEVTAEATRNPEVAEICRKADAQLHAQAVAALRQDHPGLSKEEATARVELLAVLYGGSVFRAVMEQHADPTRLAALYREVIERLIPGLSPRRAAQGDMSQ
jgi:AcrR family transcriptional regulator